MDVNGVEQVNVVACFGGFDNLTVNDLTGTGVTDVNLDLAGIPGGNTGDGQADAVIVNGTAAADSITVSGSGGTAVVAGLSAAVHITHAESAFDSLHVNGLGGNDMINASRLHECKRSRLTLDGGDGDDILTGSAGNDTIIGGRGSDVAFMGAGNDTFVWNPGDGSDVVEGQGGNDTLQFNGANVSENIDLSANGSRLRLSRTERGQRGHGRQRRRKCQRRGPRRHRHDYRQRPVPHRRCQREHRLGEFARKRLRRRTGRHRCRQRHGWQRCHHGHRQAPPTPTFLGLAARVHITGAEAANDRLIVNALGGDDVVDASALSANAIQLTENGGDGNDVLIGGAGNDTLLGGNT